MDHDALLQKLLALPVRKEKALTSMHQMDAVLGHPHQAFKSIHVAGTNGKGSVVTKIAKALQEDDFKVGFYTSPHLVDVRERIRVNGEKISQEDFFQILSDLFRLDVHGLSFFDLLTHLAFVYFQKQKVDWAVVEAGLGGRFDATNIIQPEIAIITSIGYDHMHLLGHTLKEIADEKRGIVKGNIPVVVGPSAAPFFPDAIVSSSAPFFDLENQETAKTALRLLSVSPRAIEQGLSVRPACRFEMRMLDGKKVILDVAHNESGFQKLLEALKHFYPQEKLHFILAFSKDKDWRSCLNLVRPHARSITAIETEKLRLESALVLQSYAPEIRISSSVSASLQREGLNILCGSFYIMDQILTIQKSDGDLGRFTH